MKITTIVLGVVSILLLGVTGYLGLMVRGGQDNLRNAHFHAAMTTATISAITHILAIIALTGTKNDAQAPAKAEG